MNRETLLITHYYFCTWVIYLLSVVIRVPAYLFFFLMIRRPPRSTLFPYDALPISTTPGMPWTSSASSTRRRPPPSPGCCSPRSEEHTSELQSRVDLVCRLLLEKKKNDTGRPSPSKKKRGAEQ